MKTIKTLSTVLLLAFSAIFLISCRSDSSDDNSGGSTYPKQVSITYRITSTTTSSLLHIGYKNEIDFLLKYCLLEKAVYELGYELNSRPRWSVIPLTGIASIMNFKTK